MNRWSMFVLVLGACGGGGDDPPRDTDVATEVTPDVADTTLAETRVDTDEDDSSILLDVDVAQFDIEIKEDTQPDTTTPLDRNCEFDPRLGNKWPDDARCASCRKLVGSPTNKVVANLMWWGIYDRPKVSTRLCTDLQEPCSGEVREAELVYCENLESGKIRVAWMDVGVATVGEGAAAKETSFRGDFDLLLGEVRVDVDTVLKSVDAFTPSTWLVLENPNDDRPDTVVVDEGRPNQQCPVGRFTRGTDNGVIQTCTRNYDQFVGH